MKEVSRLISQFLKTRGVDRVFSLCGGHILPIWDHTQVACAEGHMGHSGPAFIDFPTDLLREEMGDASWDKMERARSGREVRRR